MKQKTRKYKKYIRKQIKKQLQTTANSLEQKIGINLSKVLDDTLQVLKNKDRMKS